MLTALNRYSWTLLAFVVSASLILGALAFQHIGGYPPCQMCYWQRYAHWAVMGLTSAAVLAASVARTSVSRLLMGLVILALLVSAGLAFWHVGVEYKWWLGPQSCMGGTGDIGAIPKGEDLWNALGETKKVVSCGDVVWKMGLSMAGWNFVISLGTALLGLMALNKPGGRNA